LRATRRISFRDRSVLITGGSRGLGLQMARQFGVEGSRVLLAARDQAELDRARDDLRDRGVDASTFACDLTDRAQAERLVEHIVARYGAIDVLINNAGIIQVGPLDHMPPCNAWFKGRHRDEFTWFAVSDSIPLMSIDSGRAAAQVIDACRHGDAELIITWPAKLAVIANAVMPDAVALGMNLANRMLPGP